MRWPAAAWVLWAAAAGAATVQGVTDEDPCFNALQVLGSHNSYHQAPEPQLLGALGGPDGPLGVWQYSHAPLGAQLDAGVRSLELDVHWDPRGGAYAQAAGLRIAGLDGWLSDPRYRQPGFKVLHVPDFDFRSSCVLLSECLTEVAAWSEAHPGHLPIQLQLEVKSGGQVQAQLGPTVTNLLQQALDASAAPGPTGLTEVPEATAQLFVDLQAELAAAFGGSSADGGRLVTPDDVRAAAGAPAGADLRALLLAAPGAGPCPWPSLSSLRGKVLVKLIQYGGSTLAAHLQTAYPDLRGSLAWVEQNSEQPLPQAAFRAVAIGRLQDAASDLSLALPANASGQVAGMADAVAAALAEGFVVRARADADTMEARAGFLARADALAAAGAHVLASDYPRLPPGPANASVETYSGSSSSGGGSTGSGAGAAVGAALLGSTYSVGLPGGQAGRCLLGSGVSGPGSNSAVQVFSAPGSSDAIYCGPAGPAASVAAAPPPAAASEPLVVRADEGAGAAPAPAPPAAPAPRAASAAAAAGPAAVALLVVALAALSALPG